MKYLALAGRICFSAIFILSAPGHFTARYVGFAAQAGVPAASLLVPLSGLIALVGGLSIALGYKAKLGGALLIAYFGSGPLSLDARRVASAAPMNPGR